MPRIRTLALVLCLIATSIQAQDSLNVELIGTAYDNWDFAENVAVSGNYAYVAAMKSGIRILDVSDPANPYEVASFSWRSDAYDVEVAGNYAYVAVMTEGLRVLDISDPLHPQEVGYVDTFTAYGVTVSGNLALIADGPIGLVVIDISNPASPVELAQLDTDGGSYDVVVSGDYAYLGDSQDGLWIVDISTPSAPLEVSHNDTAGWIQDLAVSGGFAFVSSGYSFDVFDVSSPDSTFKVGHLSLSTSAKGVILRGDSAYVANDDDGLRVINISDPTTPVEVSSCDSPGTATGVTCSGEYFYLADGYGGLRIFAFQSALLSPGGQREPFDMRSQGVAPPPTLTEIGHFVTPGLFQSVALSGGYACLAARNGSMNVADISNPENMTDLGSVNTDDEGRRIAVAGEYAYVADTKGGLRVINISDKENPVETGVFDNDHPIKDVAISGNYAYVADEYSGLRVIDVSNPASPVEHGSYALPSWTRGVAVQDSLVGVMNVFNGFFLFNVSDPSTPVLLDTVYGFDYVPENVCISGDHAYLGANGGRLHVVDISDPANAVLVSSYYDPGNYSNFLSVAVSGDFVFTVCSTGGMYVVDVSDPTYPVKAGYYDTPGNAYGIALSGDTAYVADYYYLEAFDCSIALTRNTTAQDLDIGESEDLQHLVSHEPTISWTYFDEFDSPQSGYQIQVSSDSTFATVDLWNAGVVSSTSTSVPYAGDPLLDGSEYFLRMRLQAEDGYTSRWSPTLSFRMNTEPTTPTPISPPDTSLVLSDLALTVSLCSDADNDTITYGFLVYSDAALTTLVRAVSGVADTAWIPDPALPDNQWYWWRAFAEDGHEMSDTTEARSFFSEILDEAPAAFNLLSPSNGDTCWTLDTTLVWQQTSDPDPDDTTLYDVWLDSLADLSTKWLVADSTVDTTCSLVDLLDDHSYYWTVRATDSNTSGTWAGDTLSFSTYLPEAPDPFLYASPDSGLVVGDDEPTVTWHPTSDPDPGDSFEYVVEWSEDAAFSTSYSATTADTFYTITDLASPSLVTALNEREPLRSKGGTGAFASTDRNGDAEATIIDGPQLVLPDDGSYYWRVKAVDSFDLETAGQDGNAWSFEVDVQEGPASFALATPSDGDTCWTLDTMLVWQQTSDPDPYDTPFYDVWLDTLADLSTKWQVADSTADTTCSLVDLLDDHTFYWTVRATDSNTAGTWASDTLSFHVKLPTAPLPFFYASPDSGSVVGDDEPTVTWHPSSDPDLGDSFEYVVEWSEDAAFSTSYSATTTDTFYTMTDLVTSGMFTTILQEPNSSTKSSLGKNGKTGIVHTEEGDNDPDFSLPDDYWYYWRVKAVDSFGLETAGQDGNAWCFKVDVQEVPASFALVTPSDGETCWTLDTTLVWRQTTDPDPYDTPFYDVWLDTLVDLSTKWLVADSTADTTCSLVDLLDNHSYYWTIRATDSNTPGTWAGDTLGFSTYLPEAPPPFALLSPADGAEIPSTDLFPLVFHWEPAEDPDPGDSLTYTLELSLDVLFTDLHSIIANSHDSALVDTLERNTYYWRVKASDNYGFETYSAETRTLDVSLSVNEWLSGLPKDYCIAALYPNPFNPSLNVTVGLPQPADLRIVLYTIMGQQVAELVNSKVPAGYRHFVFNGSHLASGVYFLRAVVPGKMIQIRKVVLMK